MSVEYYSEAHWAIVADSSRAEKAREPTYSIREMRELRHMPFRTLQLGATRTPRLHHRCLDLVSQFPEKQNHNNTHQHSNECEPVLDPAYK